MPVHWQTDAIVALIDAAPDGILLVDPEGVIRLANDAAGHLFGYRNDELYGAKIELLIPQRFHGAHVVEREGYAVAPRQRPMGTGLELTGLRSDGDEFPVEISLAPMRWQDQDLVVTIVRDRTEQRAVEAQRLDLARAQAVEDVLAGVEALVWESVTVDRSSHSYLGGSDAALLGYRREQWLQDGFWLSIMHPEETLTPLIVAESARAQARFELEYRLIAADGSIHHVRDIVTVSRTPDGEIDRLRGVIVDVTDQRNLEQKLAQAQKMEAVGQLAGGVAHDFNNLLTIASGYAHRLIGLDALAAHHTDLAEIISATDRAAALTAQLLSFARRGQGKVEDLDPNETLRSLEPLLKRVLDADVIFSLDLDEHAPVVRANRSDLEQVVMNLVLNARDAMPGGGRLTVRSQACQVDTDEAAAYGVLGGLYLQIDVTDSGDGMPAEVQEHIFEPFYTTKPHGKGTGMGLATVYGIVEHAGGYIDVDSTPGAGTAFRFVLPAAEQVATAQGARGTVLLVEDEDALRRLATAILAEEGFHVLPAGNGLDALALAARHSGILDLLLTDVVLPNISGPELAKRLCDLRPGLQVLFMSGYNDSRLIARGVHGTQMPLLSKPFRPDELTQKVSEMIAVGRAAR